MPTIERMERIATGGTAQTVTIAKPSGAQVRITEVSFHSDVESNIQQIAHLQRKDETNLQILIVKQTFTLAAGYTWREPQGQMWPENYDLVLTLNHATSGSKVFVVITYEELAGKQKKGWIF